MLKTLIVLKAKKESDMRPETIAAEMLTRVIQKLESRGIKCSKIKGGGFCIYSKCIMNKSKVSTLVSVFSQHDEIVIPVQCKNSFPLWRCILSHPGVEEQYSGGDLQEFVQIVDKIISEEKYFTRSQWIDAHEYWTSKKK